MSIDGRPVTDSAPDLAQLFEATGVPAALVPRAVARLGADAAGSLRADPWLLLRVPGVLPRQADHFARRLLGEDARPDDPRRGAALALHLLTEAARQGHTATPVAEVVSALEALRVPDARRAIDGALDTGEAVPLIEEPEFDPESPEALEEEPPEPEESLGVARWALAEEAAAEGFQRLAATAAPLLDDAAIKEVRQGLPEDRSLALTAALRTGVSVLRGAPGDLAGTALGIASVAAERGLRVAVVTPTDHAAALLARGRTPAGQVVGLHRLLEAQPAPETAPPGTVVFGRGEQNPCDLDLVLVPDASGLDVEMVAMLVEACPDGAHLVLGGEPGALPPAGPGRVLDDLEASDTVPVVALEPGGEAGPLRELTAAVRAGELISVDAPDREVVVVPAASGAEAVHRAVQLVTDSIPRALGIPAQDVQVVAPATAGEAGVAALNTALKDRLNPGPGKYGGFDPGDRVIVAVPLPQAALGEPGVVTGAAADGLQVEFTGGTATIAPALTTRLRHGWAATVALARGTRHPAVVAVMPGDAEAGLSRPMVATAFGLALRHLSVVQAAGPALARAVREVDAPPRRTRLTRLLVR